MTSDPATGRLEQAEGIPDLLGAAYGAFEHILATARLAEGRAGIVLLPAFTLAAAAAASGRDAIASALSLPSATLLAPPGPAQGSGGDVADHLAVVALVLQKRLAAAEVSAAADRAACGDGAAQAARIHELLAGSGLWPTATPAARTRSRAPAPSSATSGTRRHS